MIIREVESKESALWPPSRAWPAASGVSQTPHLLSSYQQQLQSHLILELYSTVTIPSKILKIWNSVYPSQQIWHLTNWGWKGRLQTKYGVIRDFFPNVWRGSILFMKPLWQHAESCLKCILAFAFLELAVGVWVSYKDPDLKLDCVVIFQIPILDKILATIIR